MLNEYDWLELGCSNFHESAKLGATGIGWIRSEIDRTRRGWCPRTGLRAAVNEYFWG